MAPRIAHKPYLNMREMTKVEGPRKEVEGYGYLSHKDYALTGVALGAFAIFEARRFVEAAEEENIGALRL